MKCFPFMKNICGARCLLVGGGKVAAKKAKVLERFGVAISVCARETEPSLAGFRVCEEYSFALLDKADFVIAATDDRALNAQVAADCRARHIPVNAVDDKENCDFYFPALIERGKVTVGISTGGASPALAAALKRYIEKLLPENLDEIAEQAEKLRGTQAYADYISEIFAETGESSDRG